MKLEALDHPKTLDLAARLKVELPTAIGYLELLWAFTAKKAPQGNVGKWPDGSIARACYCNGDPSAFVTALVGAGFLDSDPNHRYLIHDWRDHAPRWVLSKLSRAKLTILQCSGDITHIYRADSSGDCSGDSVREGKGRQGKRSGTTVAPLPADDAEFSSLQSVYPKRGGSNPWPKARKAINARLAEGHTWGEILEGAHRYAEFIRATGKERTEFVLQASTFCGPDKRFLEPWELPPTKAQVQQDGNVDAGREWLRQGAAA